MIPLRTVLGLSNRAASACLPLRFAVLASLAALLLADHASAAPASVLRVGVAKTDITPDLPVTMAGYESRKALSQGVHDPLSARAVALESDGARIVLVSTDVLGFYGGSAEILRSALLRDCQLKPSELFLAAIHTHSAPTVTFNPTTSHSNNVAYSDQLQQKLAAVIRAALKELRPGELGYGSGSSPVGANRRQPAQDENGKPKIVLGRNPAAMTDREVQVLKLMAVGATNPAAVLFGYATHSTSLGPQNYIISGDVHGLAEQFVERHLGGHVVVPGFAGASGDIDPWTRVLPGFKTDNGWLPEPVLLGTLLGEEVVRVQEGIQRLTNSAPIRSLFQALSLPGKAAAGATTNAPAVPLNITVARVGAVAFVGLGGEVFNEIGRAIKSRSPFPFTFVMTHCNGTAGYLPTSSSYPEGGYEVQSTPFAPGAAELIPDRVIALLKELERPAQ